MKKVSKNSNNHKSRVVLAVAWHLHGSAFQGRVGKARGEVGNLILW